MFYHLPIFPPGDTTDSAGSTKGTRELFVSDWLMGFMMFAVFIKRRGIALVTICCLYKIYIYI